MSQAYDYDSDLSYIETLRKSHPGWDEYYNQKAMQLREHRDYALAHQGEAIHVNKKITATPGTILQLKAKPKSKDSIDILVASMPFVGPLSVVDGKPCIVENLDGIIVWLHPITRWESIKVVGDNDA